jgi:cytochrome c-type biogenesis protein CcmH/NrfG
MRNVALPFAQVNLVDRQSHAPDRASVALQSVQHAPGFEVPHLQRVVLRRGHRTEPVRRHRNRENKPGEAIPVFHEALGLNPRMPDGQYYLAGALRATGDFAGAEAALREALKRRPNSGPVHNFLGILIFKRGDVPGAVAEFRTSAQLQPTDAAVHS